MKRIAIAILMVLLLASPALAEKIGVVNLQKIMTSSEPAQQAMTELQNKYKSIKEKLDAKKEEVQALREEMNKQKMVLSQEAKMDKEMELKRKIRNLQDEARNYQRKIQMEQKELSDPILEVLEKVLEDYGKKHGYTMIMDSQNSGLLYAKDSLEITDKIMVELNKAWRAKNKDSQ